MGSTTYVYDYAGQRIKRNTTVYIGNLYECTSVWSTTCTRHIFAGSQRIAQHTGSTLYYYHGDHLGSSTVITGTGGTLQKELHYHPYGVTYYSSGSPSVKYKFTSAEEDTNGFYHLGARYYDPTIGRFLSADSIVPDYSDPQTLNRYSYCRNNPIIYTDPSGHIFLIDDIIIAAATYVAAHAATVATGAAVGAVVGGTTSAISGGNILQGMALGAVSGAVLAGIGGFVGDAITYAAVPGGIGPPTAGWAAAGNIGGAMAGGAASGAATAALTGRNVWEGAKTGLISAGITSSVMYGLGQLMGNQSVSSTEEIDKNSTYNLNVDRNLLAAAQIEETANDIGGILLPIVDPNKPGNAFNANNLRDNMRAINEFDRKLMMQKMLYKANRFLSQTIVKSAVFKLFNVSSIFGMLIFPDPLNEDNDKMLQLYYNER